MGFYVRKSLKAGPFRFNFSNSGVGVSVGVPGFRVGLAGPRGHYVHVGRGGLYYRKSFSASRASRRHPGESVFPRRPLPGGWPSPQVGRQADDVVMRDVTGATIFELASAGATDLVHDLTRAQRRFRFFRAAVVCFVALALSMLTLSRMLAIVVVACAIVAGFYVHQWDRARRSVVAYYDVDDEIGAAYQGLVDAASALKTSARSWQVAQAGAVRTTYRYKVSAGASQLINTVSIAIRHDGPPVLVTNISVPSLVTDQRAIFLMPDRALVREGVTYAEVPYSKLQVDFGYSRFIEPGRPPRDAEVVDYTWRYVNVNGGPDRRFNNNARLAVTRLAQVALTTSDGLHAVLQFSRQDVASNFAHAVDRLAGLAARLPVQLVNSQPTEGDQTPSSAT